MGLDPFPNFYCRLTVRRLATRPVRQRVYVHLERNAAEGIHRVEDAYVNWYIVESDDGITIVDAGHPTSWKSLQRALKELKRKLEDIRALVLTHGHFDHVGFARKARTELGVPVLAPPGERHLVANPWDYDHEKSRLRNVLE